MSNHDVTVAIFGDCATQMIAQEYKHTRAVGLTNWLSIVSPTTEKFMLLTRDKLNDTSLSNYMKRTLVLDSSKKTLQYLLEEKADYLIIDCNDCRQQVIIDRNFGDKAYITSHWRNKEYKKCLEIMFGSRGQVCVPSTKIDFAEYKKAVEIICNEIKKVYSTDRIIINKHYYVDYFFNDTGMHRYNKSAVDEDKKTLQLIKDIEVILENNLEGCHVIEFPNDVLGDPKHKLGICSLHYHSLYYEYGREALNIISQKKTDEKLLLSQLHHNYSLQFKILKMQMLEDWKHKVLEKQVDNLVKFGTWRELPQEEDVSKILTAQKDICGYLDLLYMLRNQIIILMAVKDTAGLYDGGIILDKLQRLGFRKFPQKFWYTYLGLIFKGEILLDMPSDIKEQTVEAEQFIGNYKIRLISKSFRMGNQALIEINGRDFSPNKRGINIVVCWATNGKVLDMVSYDTHIMDFFSRNVK